MAIGILLAIPLGLLCLFVGALSALPLSAAVIIGAIIIASAMRRDK